MTESELYVGREQTLVKHFILRKYLERFAHIVCSPSSLWNTLTYVDCFSGPWNAQSERYEDSSFSIALAELKKAQETLEKLGKNITIRCFFLEKNPEAFAKLQAFSSTIEGATVAVENAALEDAIPKILAFVKEGGPKSFPFFFIDPTGWTGFGMETIAPLLQHMPGEVLINFMTGHIQRFIQSPDTETQESFRKLFGSEEFKARLQGLEERDREDEAVKTYSQTVQKTGRFQFVSSAIVLHPEKDRTHFHLIYGTRSPIGLKVFKEVEKGAMIVQEKARAEAAQRRRVSKTSQLELLDSEDLHDQSHYENLRERYLEKSKSNLVSELSKKKRLLFEESLALAISEPMTWESDLKNWIKDWVDNKFIRIEGMKANQRVPKTGEKNFLVLQQISRP